MRTSKLEDVARLFREGRFRAALLALGEAEPHEPQLKLHYAEALDEVGESERALEVLRRLVSRRDLPADQGSAARRALASVYVNLGHITEGTECVKEALSIAEASGLVEEAAISALALYSLTSNLYGPSAAAPVLSTAKKYVLRSSTDRLLADLHSRVGQADAQESRYLSAKRHLSVALELLDLSPHLGLLARVNLALSSTYALLADNTAAMRLAGKALAAADEAGSSRLALLCRANLAQLQFRSDELEGAALNASEVLRQVSKQSPLRLAVLETYVAACIEVNDWARCTSELREFESFMLCSADSSWVSVEATPTFVRLLLQRGNRQEALVALHEGLERSRRRSNASNTARLLLLSAEIEALDGATENAWRSIAGLEDVTGDPTADIVATAERVKGILSVTEGAKALARQQFGRAERIFQRCGLRLEARRTRALRERLLAATPTRRITVRQAGQREFASGLECLSSLVAYPHILSAEIVRFLRRHSLGDARQVDAPPAGTTSTAVLHLGPRNGVPLALRFESIPAEGQHQLAQSLVRTIREAVDRQRSKEQVEQLNHFWDSDVSPEGSYGLFISPEMKALLKSAILVARTDLPVLILGETGTGKEILAKEIHAASRRAKNPFLPFNVTAVSGDLLESQLFGARKGSFTGATHDSKGLLREAEGGTVFLDEIGEMSLEMQPKLLRFVEQGEIQPIGERPLHVDVRIIAATNASLQDLVRQGRFREDLYQRLRVVPLTIPPLRERREEIATFARHFIARHAEREHRPVPDISPRALEHLVAADWPGNVRQLNNELKRVVALLPEGARIELDHLSPELQRPPSPQPLAFDSPTGRMSINLDRPIALVLEDVERAALLRVMTVCSGNQTEAARRLGTTRKGLYLKLKRLGMLPD